VARLLIEHGADIEAKDNEGGNTPLHWAVDKNSLDVARLLIDSGANTEGDLPPIALPLIISDSRPVEAWA
jgi:ankyrin repeat protein